MIVGDLKPLEEIVSTINEFKNILVVGCGGCVSVCLTGGEKEAHSLAGDLSKTRHYKNNPPNFQVDIIQRQCEPDWLEMYFEIPENIDAVLTLACGAGVQTMATIFEPLPVIPALNTSFIGSLIEPGVFQEMCRGCGDCMLAYTGGICPVARCAKSVFNGPCGGASNGSCEIDKNTPCAWMMIFYRLKKMNRLDLMHKVKNQRDWRPAGMGGPRSQKWNGKE